MIHKEIDHNGETVIVACDGRCHKAWGRSGGRPRVGVSVNIPENFEWLADHEVDRAPDDPETSAGGHRKPTAYGNPGVHRLNKWCVLECERSGVFAPDQPRVLHDWSKRYRVVVKVRELLEA